MSKSLRPLLAITAFVICANFSTQEESVSGRTKPQINFYGKLTDTSGSTYEVENITISGMYKQIAVYQKPAVKSMDPANNTTKLDFAEIDSISVPQPEVILTFNNRQYIEITVTSKDPKKTSETYIIERSKRVICDQINTAGPIEKDLSFQAVDVLVFEGHKSAPQKEDAVN